MKDLSLYRKAMQEGWDVPQRKRKKIVKELCGTMATTKDDLLAIRCIEFLVQAQSKNLKAAIAVTKHSEGVS